MTDLEFITALRNLTDDQRKMLTQILEGQTELLPQLPAAPLSHPDTVRAIDVPLA